MKKGFLLICAFVLIAASSAGCGKSGNNGNSTPGDGKPAATKATDKPVELVFTGLPITEEEFQAQFGLPIHEKYPHITTKYIQPGKGTELKDLVNAGTIPDVYMTATVNLPIFLGFKLGYDLNEFIKKNSLDMTRFEPNSLQVMKDMTAEQMIFGLPYQSGGYVLYYNKDVFDKFGVPYPKDGMTWDDTYELAKKLTRVEGGTTYRGFTANWSNIFLTNNQLGLAGLDSKTDKAAINTDQWKMVFNNVKRFFDIPGNERTKDNVPNGNQESDFLTGTVAMTATGIGLMTQAADKGNLNFDYVALPTYKEAPGVGTKTGGRYLLPTSTSKYKDEVFRAISYLTTEEYQMRASKEGRATALVNKDVQKAYMQNHPKLKDKNNFAYFYNKVAPTPPTNPSLVEINTYNIAAAELTKVLIGETDVSTALRVSEEKINQAVAAKKSQ